MLLTPAPILPSSPHPAPPAPPATVVALVATMLRAAISQPTARARPSAPSTPLPRRCPRAPSPPRTPARSGESARLGSRLAPVYFQCSAAVAACPDAHRRCAAPPLPSGKLQLTHPPLPHLTRSPVGLSTNGAVKQTSCNWVKEGRFYDAATNTGEPCPVNTFAAAQREIALATSCTAW